jgi:RNA polymerase sigma factor (sigma-70 family)
MNFESLEIPVDIEDNGPQVATGSHFRTIADIVATGTSSVVRAYSRRPSATGDDQDRTRLAGLVRRAAERDDGAIAELYDATSPWLYGLISRIVRDCDLAEEVTLDTYVQVWRRAGTYKESRGTVRAWLATMGRSRALDALRSVRSRKEISVEELPQNTTEPEQPLAVLEREQCLSGALQNLPADQRLASSWRISKARPISRSPPCSVSHSGPSRRRFDAVSWSSTEF